jgi:hypothetical protein
MLKSLTNRQRSTPRQVRPLLKPVQLKPDQDRPSLEMIRIPVFRVHYQALERFITAVYRSCEVDFLDAAGAVPGMIPEFDVTGKLPEGRDWEKRIDWIKSGGRISRYASLVLELLVFEKYIPAGKYIIDTKAAPDPTEVYKQLITTHLDPLHPQCLAFKDRHANDVTFTKRAALVDAAVMESLSA